ncbi:hypothetical protein ATE84_1400 [Aquimarina sp. MAR_2010_214]|uniref:hypothetical protein n=1 Tax=Aquimarina sp. MAR_2010_214 TaxID=1250026 RepID=UPI000C703C07|nr:hypothetical protein [Aquimarina sp. MAR_2010_214]PKV49378.1 hypothetical protein ATE84_1400 [Aquimarina sp. MAR_2010_214]
MDKKTNFIGYPIVIIITAILTFLVIRKCENPDLPIVTKPKEIISFKDATELYNSYTKNRVCVIKTFEGKRDYILDSLCPTTRKPNDEFMPSRSFYLSKKFLDQYIAYVNQITPDTIDITGYRLYLGNYPDKEKFDDGKSIPDPRRNTFFIAPTTLKGDTDLHRGFTFVDRNSDGKPEIIFLENEFDHQKYGQNLNQTKINTASFFSFINAYGPEKSTIGNDVGSHP